MGIKLSEKIKAIPVSSFSWTSFTKHITTDDDATEQKMFITFKLLEPIEEVTGTQKVTDGKRSVPLYVNDVEEVSIWMDVLDRFEGEFTFEKEEITYDTPGKYSGNLMLDVSQSEKVWLTDVPLSKLSYTYKDSFRSKRIDEIEARRKNRS